MAEPTIDNSNCERVVRSSFLNINWEIKKSQASTGKDSALRASMFSWKVSTKLRRPKTLAFGREECLKSHYNKHKLIYVGYRTCQQGACKLSVNSARSKVTYALMRVPGLVVMWKGNETFRCPSDYFRRVSTTYTTHKNVTIAIHYRQKKEYY